ncbi:helix-turn-helix domain-containing protein [Nocardia sp. NPDC051030]|uniref:TetR/AcrR family transcriptional regulator n=1 Tax=Nocardia sp. NPDC051030 TaxID=3155162 RepID=UPI00344A20BE
MEVAALEILQLFATALGVADPESRHLLDAARAEFIEHGFRRTSVGDIARRAAVSRPTVYRRLGDKDTIVRAVIARDAVEFMAGMQEKITKLKTPTGRIEEVFVLGMRMAATHPLLQAVVRFDPETMPSMFAALNDAAMGMVRDIVASLLNDDSLGELALPMEDGRRVADVLLRIAATHVIAPSELMPLDTDKRTREFARTYFNPIIESVRSA